MSRIRRALPGLLVIAGLSWMPEGPAAAQSA